MCVFLSFHSKYFKFLFLLSHYDILGSTDLSYANNLSNFVFTIFIYLSSNFSLSKHIPYDFNALKFIEFCSVTQHSILVNALQVIKYNS